MLRALRLAFGDALTPESLTAIVAVSDDGGSSGQLRSELGMLAPGDVRNCLAALADDSSSLARLMQHRFSDGKLQGHSVGNLLLAALTQQMNGDFSSAVEALARIIGVGGRVLPATRQHVNLRAEFHDGEVVTGETAIVARHRPIRRLSLDHAVRPLPEAIEALVNADVIIVGPGSLYTSILPVLLVDGIAPTIFGVRATRVYVANLMTEPGETDDFTLERHLDVIEQHVGLPLFDYVLANNAPISLQSLARYAQTDSRPVCRASVQGTHRGATIVEQPLSWEVEYGKIRHAPAGLAEALRNVVVSSWERDAAARLKQQDVA